MANPRQRRKARSSAHRPVSQSRRAKKILKKTPPIRGPKVLQDAWDKRKTVRQNYAALGLVHSTDPLASGGIEPSESFKKAEQPSTADDAPVAGPSTDKSNGTIPRGHGRIVRDEAGNVVGVELADGDDDDKNANHDITMEDLQPQVDEKTQETWIAGLGGGRLEGTAPPVVEALERISSNTKCDLTTVSASITGVGPRHASSGEVAYMARLVDKYGQDVEKMAKDRKLNSEQRTAAELRRSLKRTGLLDGGSRAS